MSHPTPQEVATRLAEIYGGTNATAQAVGISRVTIGRILSGHITPSKSLAAHLERELVRIERYQG